MIKIKKIQLLLTGVQLNIIFHLKIIQLRFLAGKFKYLKYNKIKNYLIFIRYFKAPELLVNHEFYNYTVDIWSAGCIFASMVYF